MPPQKKQRTDAGLVPTRPVLPGPPARAAQIQLAAATLLKENASDVASTGRIELLKMIERLGGESFRTMANETDPTRKAEMERVVFESNMAGLAEGSDRFNELISLKQVKVATAPSHRIVDPHPYTGTPSHLRPR